MKQTEDSQNQFQKDKQMIKGIVIGSNQIGGDTLEYYLYLKSKNAVRDVPHFLIDNNANLHQILEIVTKTQYTINSEHHFISIELENPNNLTKNENNKYHDVFSNIYYSEVEVFSDNVRGYQYWYGYSKEQIKTLNTLLDSLCSKYDLKRALPTDLSKISETQDIYFRSNFSLLQNDPNKSIYDENKQRT